VTKLLIGEEMKKSVLKSKTFYFGLATAIAPLFPVVGEYLSANAAQIGMIWGAVSIVLRMVTKEKVVLID
jgi:hypothetical protein